MEIIEKLGPVQYREFLQSCIIHPGNNDRIKKAFSRDRIKLTFLGTSITIGYSSSGFVKDCYPKVIAELLHSSYPDKTIEFNNLGISGVNSSYGLLQTEQHLHEEQPDLIIVEYAVNEGKDYSYINTYESLIRNLLQLESKPAVLILAVISHTYYSCGDFMSEIGVHYDLPVIGLHNAIPDYIAKGYLRWEDYSDDDVHANNEGHRLLADCLYYAIDLAMTTDRNPPYRIPEQCCYAAPFEGLALMDFHQSQSMNGTFQIQPTQDYGLILEHKLSPAGTVSTLPFLTFQCRCRAMIAAFEQSNDIQYGILRVLVDGKEVCLLKGYSIFGWNNPVSQILFTSEEKAMHTIEFHMTEPDKMFRILQLGWC